MEWNFHWEIALVWWSKNKEQIDVEPNIIGTFVWNAYFFANLGYLGVQGRAPIYARIENKRPR